MMSIAEFLDSLREQGIELRPEGERLRYRIPKDKQAIMPELLKELAKRKVV